MFPIFTSPLRSASIRLDIEVPESARTPRDTELTVQFCKWLKSVQTSHRGWAHSSAVFVGSLLLRAELLIHGCSPKLVYCHGEASWYSAESNREHTITVSVRFVRDWMYLLDLPHELIITILEHVFEPWSATMDLTCQLGSIPNIRILRTCRFFNEYGGRVLRSAFTGKFVREDSRGCIKDPNLPPRAWYSWIMRNCKTLMINDAYYTSLSRVLADHQLADLH